MDPEIKAKWVTALRSGNYQQGKGQLRLSNPTGPDQFCCLGVLCDIVEPAAWAPADSSQYRHGEDIGQPCVSILSNVGLLTTFEDTSAPVDVLVSMNDDQGATFDVIADWIEANL